MRKTKTDRKALLFLLAFYLILLSVAIYGVINHADTGSEKPTQDKQAAEYIFKNDDGAAVDLQAMTTAWATEAGYEKRYDITDAERWEIASAVTAEAVGEPFAGKVAVAQCILQACEDDGIRPTEALTKYGYSKKRPEPTDEALEAVQAVFDHGDRVTSEPIKYFYAPAVTVSSWHESQDCVLTINNHKFFKEQQHE